MSWGIGYTHRGPLDPLPGEPDRAEVLEEITTWIEHGLHEYERRWSTEIDKTGRIVIEVFGYRYRLALVAVEEVDK